jgi:GSH-dependent disulfide-bond oxidoreductase
LIELYGSPTPNVLKVILLLEEIEARYEIRRVDVWRGEQFSEAFVALNPNSKVPVIVDREAPGGQTRNVFESGAILFYLAEKSGRFLPEEGWGRYEVMQWLMFQVAGLGPMSGQFNHFHMFAPEGNDYSRSRYTTELHRLYGVIERRLASVPFIGGAGYSIADMSVFPWIRNQARRFGPDFEWLRDDSAGHPALARWFNAVSERPGVRRALQVFDAISSTLKNATADDLDRIFGRGRYAVDSQKAS